MSQTIAVAPSCCGVSMRDETRMRDVTLGLIVWRCRACEREILEPVGELDLPLPEPTSAPPGSDEKIEVMADRAKRNLSIFHPDDGDAPAERISTDKRRGRRRAKDALFRRRRNGFEVRVHLGTFESEEAACQARNRALELLRAEKCLK